MFYNLAKAFRTSNDKGNFSPERKTHKKPYGATKTTYFDAEITEVVKKSMRKWAPLSEQSGVLS